MNIGKCGFFMRKDYGQIILFGMISIIILWIMKYVLPYFLPFAVALITVVPLHASFIRKGRADKKGRGIMAGGIVFILLLVIALVFVGLGTFMMSKAQTLMGNLGRVEQACGDFVQSCCVQIENYMGLKNGILYIWLENRFYDITKVMGVQSGSLVTKTIQYVIGIGKLCTFLLVSFICVVLFAREIDRWQQGLLNAAAASPALDRILAIILRIGKKLGSMMKTFVRTQGIILLCISITAVTGLSIAGVHEGWFYGILAGVMDVLPFIGTGIVLVPIAVMQLIEGHILGAVIVGITYLICVCIREVLEPRLMGSGVQVSSVAMLIAVYAGVLYYGIGGVLLGPVTLLILVETAREIFHKETKSV